MMEGPLIDFGEPIAGNRTPYYGYGEGFAQSRPAVAASGPNHAGVGSDKNGGLAEIDFTRTITTFRILKILGWRWKLPGYLLYGRHPKPDDVDDRPSIDFCLTGQTMWMRGSTRIKIDSLPLPTSFDRSCPVPWPSDRYL